MYNPDTSPAIVADEPSEVAYSVTVDINAYITSAEKSRAPNTKKKSFVKIFSSLTFAFIDEKYVNQNLNSFMKKEKKDIIRNYMIH